MKRRVSVLIRCYHWTEFRSLTIGMRFRFASEVNCPGLIKAGICEKTATRKYRFVDDDNSPDNTIGSISTIVLLLNADGKAERMGTYTPALQD